MNTSSIRVIRGATVFLLSLTTVLLARGEDANTMAAYLNATEIPIASTETDDYPAWQGVVTNSAGIAVTITAEPKARTLGLRFADERRPHVLLKDTATPQTAKDDETVMLHYPRSLKLSADGRVLYVDVLEVQRVPTFGWRSEETIHTFDLEKREPLGKIVREQAPPPPIPGG